jgi:hypothetical protein
MSLWADIRYRDFWDIPRMFVVEYVGHRYLFDNKFDEEVEDYTLHYDVFELPLAPELDLSGSWVGLRDRADRPVGQVPLGAVRFDETKRKYIDTSVIEGLTGGARPAGPPEPARSGSNGRTRIGLRDRVRTIPGWSLAAAAVFAVVGVIVTFRDEPVAVANMYTLNAVTVSGASQIATLGFVALGWWILWRRAGDEQKRSG